MNPSLFDPFSLRGITLPNRIGLSPMCTYAAGDDGKPTDWHLAHLLSRAIGGAGLIFAEDTAISKDGRITSQNLGLWDDNQIAAHKRLTSCIIHAGSIPAIQLGHAGRRGSRLPPWLDGPSSPEWEVISASDLPLITSGAPYSIPRPMTECEIMMMPDIFAAAARRAVLSGYKLIEIHAAHGYLLHQFLSPLSNRRNDKWGGDFEGRTRLSLDVLRKVRATIPDMMPLSLRVSHTDWIEGGWTTEETIEFAKQAKLIGVDLIDVSSGGINLARQKQPNEYGYQVPGAAAIRRGAKIAVAAVGLISDAKHAQSILSEGKADIILIGRAMLRDPYWAARAAAALGCAAAIKSPAQYERGWNKMGPYSIDPEIKVPLLSLDSRCDINVTPSEG